MWVPLMDVGTFGRCGYLWWMWVHLIDMSTFGYLRKIHILLVDVHIRCCWFIHEKSQFLTLDKICDFTAYHSSLPPPPPSHGDKPCSRRGHIEVEEEKLPSDCLPTARRVNNNRPYRAINLLRPMSTDYGRLTLWA